MKMSFPWWVAGCLVVVSCAGDGAYKLGEDMSDAGRVLLGDALVDGGEALQDAGMMARSDARADDPPRGRVVDLPCTSTNSYTLATAPTGMGPRTSFSRTTEYYAELRDPSIRAGNIQEVTAILCDYQSFSPEWRCPAIADCTGSPRSGPINCTTTSPVFEDGRILVSCGSIYETGTIGSPPSTTGGYRYRTARIVIR
jgi:hypothetical protein